MIRHVRRAAAHAMHVATVSAVLAPVAVAGAQDWQVLEARRPARDSAPVHVRLTYGVGTLRVHPSDDSALYDLRLRYDASHMNATADWRSDSRTLRVETRPYALRVPSDEGANLSLGLTRRVPLDLDVQLGAVSAELDLTGLKVRSLDFASGASEATVRFDTTNVTPLERVALQVGAGTLRIEGLGHAQVRRLDASGGVGELVLGFAGSWAGEIDVDLSLAIGQATLVVPADAGVRVDASARWLDTLELPGFIRDGDALISAGYAVAPRKLRVDLTSVLGRVRVERR